MDNANRRGKQTSPQHVKRTRSKISSVQHDIATVAAAVDTLRSTGPEPRTIEELGARLGLTKEAMSTLRLKLQTGRTYQYVQSRHNTDSNKGEYIVTLLGYDLRSDDEQRRIAARVIGFLSVPLYFRLAEMYDGGPLPETNELEEVLKRLGVPPKQAQNMRQTFIRSAEQATIFERAQNHFEIPSDISLPDELASLRDGRAASGIVPHETEAAVIPSDVPAPSPTNGIPVASANAAPVQDSDEGGFSEMYAALFGLWQRFARGGSKWTVEQRDEWMETFSRNFRLFNHDEP